jgi:hypothetical protein
MNGGILKCPKEEEVKSNARCQDDDQEMDKESPIPKRGMSVSTENEKPGKHDEGRDDEANHDNPGWIKISNGVFPRNEGSRGGQRDS